MQSVAAYAAKLGEKQGADCERTSKVEPEIDIQYKSEDKGGDNAKAC